nr:hypothetical protein [uncultured Fluviicola sp.]
MIQKLIFNGLILIAFNCSLAQKHEGFTWQLQTQNLNPDSLRADSIKRINAFPEYFRPYVQELRHQAPALDAVVRMKREYQDLFIREFLTPWDPIVFGTPISTDTLILSDSIQQKMQSFIHDKCYFGFRNSRLSLVEKTTYNQRGGVTWHIFISADQRAVLFYVSNDYSDAMEDNSKFYYYYYENGLVAVRVPDRVFTTETELSQFADMKSLPGIVALMFELEEYIKK